MYVNCNTVFIRIKKFVLKPLKKKNVILSVYICRKKTTINPSLTKLTFRDSNAGIKKKKFKIILRKISSFVM